MNQAERLQATYRNGRNPRHNCFDNAPVFRQPLIRPIPENPLVIDRELRERIKKL